MNSKCIVCGSRNTKAYKAAFVPFLNERMFVGVEQHTDLINCVECGFSYSSYRPSNIELGRLYQGYRDEYYQQQRAKYENYYTWEFNESLGFSRENQEVRNKIMLDTIERYVNSMDIKTILDYGGDSGQYIPNKYVNAKKFVYDISGVQAVSGVKKIDEASLASQRWDLIMCCHVLEHDTNPLDIVRKIKALMHVGSYLYIELPYETYIYDCISGSAALEIPIHEHINFFKPKTLDTIFNDIGFVVLAKSLKSIPDVSGKAFGQHICCLIKKIDNNDTSILLKQIISVKTELLEALSQSDILNDIHDDLSSFRQEGAEKEKEDQRLNMEISDTLKNIRNDLNSFRQENAEKEKENQRLHDEALKQKNYKGNWRAALIIVATLLIIHMAYNCYRI